MHGDRMTKAEMRDGAYALGATLGVLLLLVIALLFVRPSYAVPFGSTIANSTEDEAPTISPSGITNNRSTITTLALSAVQQDQQWKAYVGNVTGILTLRDSTNYAIYEWPLTGATIAGEVFASRSNSVVWSNITCANSTLIAAEEVFHNMTPGSVDSINLTFNYTLHSAMQIGPKIIPESNCSVTATYVNNTAQTVNQSARYQELLLQDGINMVFATFIEDNAYGFNNDGAGSNSTYDFQMLVPESDVKATPTTYYFYTEIGA
jgi:hypothetical protein